MKHLLAITVILLLAAGAARADVPAFDELDADDDGKISRQEAAASAALEGVFSKADEDKDDRLDQSEFVNAIEIIRKEENDKD